MSHSLPLYNIESGVQPSGMMGALKQKVKDFFANIDTEWSEIDDTDDDSEDESTRKEAKKSSYNTVYNSSTSNLSYNRNKASPNELTSSSLPRKATDFVSRIMNREISSIYPNSPSFRATLADATAAYSSVPPISYQRRASIALTK